MTIKLLEPIQISGVHTPVDGSHLSLPPEIEAGLVAQNKASWVVKRDSNKIPAMVEVNSLTRGIGLSVGAATAQIASFGGAGVSQLPTVNTDFHLADSFLLPANSLGLNGSLTVSLDVSIWQGNPITAYVMFGGQPVNTIASAPTQTGLLVDFTIYNRNNTQSQRGNRNTGGAGNIYNTQVNTEKDLWLELFISKSVAADAIRVHRFEATAKYNSTLVAESKYHTAGGQQIVVEADLLQYPLSTAAANDPYKAVRNLASTAYAFPPKFFNLCCSTYPITTSTPPVTNTKGLRSGDFYGLSWDSMQTAQAVAAYPAPVTGFESAPAGISATGLAKLDTLIDTCAAQGLDFMYHAINGNAPSWVKGLGGTSFPFSIPAGGANRTSLLASLGFYIRYLCKRYTLRRPALTWYIEPLNEVNTGGVWVGVVADLVALTSTFSANITTFGSGKVKRLSPSWTEMSGIDGSNDGGVSANGTTSPSFYEWIAGGGWPHCDIVSYHPYGGTLLTVDQANPQKPFFCHDMRAADPLQNAISLGRQIGLLGIIGLAGLGTTIVPGVSSYGSKPIWFTESGDAYSATRDRNFYIRLALVCTALGIPKMYFFGYFGGANTAFLNMDLSQGTNAPEFQAAQDFLYGKTINWVNANNDLTKVAASINGTVYRF